jgi:hypothetical protein
MGVGSTQRQKYYLVLGGIYLIVGILPIALFSSTSDCPTICALRFPDRPWKNWECTKEVGTAVTNYLDVEEYKRIYKQFYMNTTGPCYVCQAVNATALLEPCKPCPAAKMTDGGVPWPATDERYSKLSSCATPGAISECAAAETANYKAAQIEKQIPKYCLEDHTCTLDSTNPLAFLTDFKPDPDIAARGILPLLLLAIGGLYLIQAIGCFISACCLQRFKDRYGDQWLNISTCDRACRGGCVRLFPKINRVLNILSLFLISFMVVVLWVWNTCADALNQFSDNVLHGTLTLWLVIVVVQYVLLCIGGTIFRTKFPEDLPFREPNGIIDRGNNAPVCCCLKCCGCCGYGPSVLKRQQWSVTMRLYWQSFTNGLQLFGP